MTDPDAIGPDGTVRLRCYLPHADIHWLSLSCGRHRPLSIHAAIALMGSGEATVGEVARRLKCRECGGRLQVQIAADPRPEWVREQEGLAPETRAGLEA